MVSDNGPQFDDDSAAEIAKEKEDCGLASPEIFPEEAEQTSASSNASANRL